MPNQSKALSWSRSMLYTVPRFRRVASSRTSFLSNKLLCSSVGLLWRVRICFNFDLSLQHSLTYSFCPFSLKRLKFLYRILTRSGDSKKLESVTSKHVIVRLPHMRWSPFCHLLAWWPHVTTSDLANDSRLFTSVATHSEATRISDV